ncbi:MAG: ATP-binding cassette domain-containing protein [Symbiopectobacterium sp.]
MLEKMLLMRAIEKCWLPAFNRFLGSLLLTELRRTVADIVELALRLHNISTQKTRKQWVQEMLDRTGTPTRNHGQYPGQLSGGNRQRVAIARALIMRKQFSSAMNQPRRWMYRFSRKSSIC